MRGRPRVYSDGDERVRRDGHVEVYSNRQWKKKCRLVWEHHNGAIPKYYSVVHSDGNRENNKISNLELRTPREQFLQVNGRETTKEDAVKGAEAARKRQEFDNLPIPQQQRIKREKHARSQTEKMEWFKKQRELGTFPERFVTGTNNFCRHCPLYQKEYHRIRKQYKEEQAAEEQRIARERKATKEHLAHNVRGIFD